MGDDTNIVGMKKNKSLTNSITGTLRDLGIVAKPARQQPQKNVKSRKVYTKTKVTKPLPQKAKPTDKRAWYKKILD